MMAHANMLEKPEASRASQVEAAEALLHFGAPCLARKQEAAARVGARLWDTEEDAARDELRPACCEADA